jgi:hypothetical protein
MKLSALWPSLSCVGHSPKGPLKQLGNPHLKPATKPKPNTPRLTMQDTAHAAEAPTAHQGGPLEGPLEQVSPHSRMRAPLGRAPPRSRGALTSSGLRLARGSAPPSNGVHLARGRSAHARLLPNAGIQCPDNGGAAPSCAWGSRPGAAAPTPWEGAHPRHCGGTVRRGRC